MFPRRFIKPENTSYESEFSVDAQVFIDDSQRCLALHLYRDKITDFPFEVQMPPSPFKNPFWKRSMMPTSAISGHHKGGLSQVEIPADFQADSSKSGSRFEFSPQQMNYENSKIEAVRLIKDLQLLLLERAPLLNDVTDDGLQLPMHLVKFLHSSGKEVLKHRRKFLEVRSWQTSAFHDNWKQRLKQREDAKRVLSELKEKQREMENKSRGGSITTTGAIHHRRTSIVSKSSRNDSISTGAHHTVLNTQTRNRLESLTSATVPPVTPSSNPSKTPVSAGTTGRRELQSSSSFISQKSDQQNIAFSLTSKLCDRMGWIVNPDPLKTLTQQIHFLKNMLDQLHDESKQIKNEPKFPAPRVRHYGLESAGIPSAGVTHRFQRRQSLRKSNSNEAPQDIYHLPMPHVGEYVEVGRNKFVISTETLTTVYNKQGSLKIIIVKNCDNKQILVFDDNRNVSANFRGDTSLIYNASGLPQLSWNQEHYEVNTYEDFIDNILDLNSSINSDSKISSVNHANQKIPWPICAMRLADPITVKLTEECKLRILSSTLKLLHFGDDGHVFELNIDNVFTPRRKKKRRENKAISVKVEIREQTYLSDETELSSGSAIALESPQKQRQRQAAVSRLNVIFGRQSRASFSSAAHDVDLSTLFEDQQPFKQDDDIANSSLKTIETTKKRIESTISKWLELLRKLTGCNMQKLIRAKQLGVKSETIVSIMPDLVRRQFIQMQVERSKSMVLRSPTETSLKPIRNKKSQKSKKRLTSAPNTIVVC